VIKLIEGHIKMVSKRLNFLLKLFKTILKEYVASEIITVYRGWKIGISRFSGDHFFLHLRRSGIGHLVLVKVGI